MIVIPSPEDIALYAPSLTDWLRKDTEVLPAGEEEGKIGWTVTEKIGITVANPRAMTMGVDYGTSIEEEVLTEEEKETRRIENKGW